MAKEGRKVPAADLNILSNSFIPQDIKDRMESEMLLGM